jgi:hypothetical protein
MNGWAGLGEELVSGDCTHLNTLVPEPAADSFGAFGPKARRFYRERDSGEVPGVAQVVTQSVDRTGGRKKLAKR